MNFLKNNFLTSIIFSELAIQKTGSDNLETITEWLIFHEYDLVEQIKVSMDDNAEPSDVSASVENPNSVSDAPASPLAKSIQCDECGKLFKTQEEVEFHATKSGNLAFKYLILTNTNIKHTDINQEILTFISSCFEKNFVCCVVF